MAGPYDAQSMVDLPRGLDAASAAAVAEQMITAAKNEKKLPENVVVAVNKMKTAHKELKTALVAKLPDADETEVGAVMREEAGVWSGIQSWLEGIARIRKSEHAAIADKLLTILFPDGLRFVRSAGPKRWTETENRLQRIVDDKLDADFAKLGGSELLVQLKAAHAASGKAGGFTAPVPAQAAAVIRSRMDALKAAFRLFALQVAANAALDESPEAQALADRLLKPLVSFVPAASARTPAPVAAEPQAVG